MKQAISCAEAVQMIPNGSRFLSGGFMGVGSPHRTIDTLAEAGGKT